MSGGDIPRIVNLDLTDWQSPEAIEARAAAIDLIAARIGGAAYPSEFESRFGGSPPLNAESITYLAPSRRCLRDHCRDPRRDGDV